MILAQKLVNKMRMNESAAIYIQSIWRKHRVSSWYKNLRRNVITLQAHSRGYLARQKFSKIKNTVTMLINLRIIKYKIIIIHNIFRERVFQLLKLAILKNLVKRNCVIQSKLLNLMYIYNNYLIKIYISFIEVVEEQKVTVNLKLTLLNSPKQLIL